MAGDPSAVREPPAPALGRISRAFEVAKGLAILLVVLGHFGTGIEFFWVAVSIGLFVFAASSAYFTSVKYTDRLAPKPYWRNKLERLAPGFFLCNAVVLAIVLIQGRPGVWTWQTIANLLGLSGFLNWFHLPNPSPWARGCGSSRFCCCSTRPIRSCAARRGRDGARCSCSPRHSSRALSWTAMFGWGTNCG